TPALAANSSGPNDTLYLLPLHMGQDQSDGGGGDALDPGGLAKGRRADALQLLPDLIGKADHRGIIQIGRQGAAFVPAEGNDVGILPVEIAGILGVYLQMLDDLGFQGPQFRPDTAEFGE